MIRSKLLVAGIALSAAASVLSQSGAAAGAGAVAATPATVASAVRADTCERPRADSPPPRRQTVRYNEWLGQTFTEVMLNTKKQSKRIRLLNRIVAKNYIQHNPLVNEGRQGLVDFIPNIYASFPDACFVLRDVFATKDRVVTRWTWTGTLTGAPFLGIEARGQKVDFDAIDVWTVRNGQLYEHWDQFDWTRGLTQLGSRTIPQPFVDVAGRPADR